MALDASIFARFAQPMRSVADYDREAYAAQAAPAQFDYQQFAVVLRDVLMQVYK